MPHDIRPSIIGDVLRELERSQKLHGHMTSRHEAYAIILEELDELWDEIKKRVADRKNMEREAIQVAAMAIKFVEEIIYRDDPVTRVEWVSSAPSSVLTNPFYVGNCTLIVGQEVNKVRGYKYEGYVRSIFVTSEHKVRVVVESKHSVGMLHIFNPEDLEAVIDGTKSVRN